MFCNTQYFDIVESDMWLNNTVCIVVRPLQQWLRVRATLLLYVVYPKQN
jgi:hypothetical protein